MKVDNIVIKNLDIYDGTYYMKRIFFTELNTKEILSQSKTRHFFINGCYWNTSPIFHVYTIVSFNMAKKLSYQEKTQKDTSCTVHIILAVFWPCELPFIAMFDSLSFSKQAFDFELYTFAELLSSCQLGKLKKKI
jgi:hypothetical protein